MEFFVKHFAELTADELYEIVKTRFEIFVLEQNIICRDLDDVDRVAIHVFCRDDKGLMTGYLRVFWKDEAAGIVQIGRVVTLVHGRGIGGALLNKGVETARAMGARSIYLHSQQYCSGYYEKAGFEVVSDVFMEEGIPHVEMIKTFQEG